MKLTIIIICIVACTSIEIQHGIPPKEIIFKATGMILNTKNFINLGIKVNTNNIIEKNFELKSQLDQIVDICGEMNSTNCKPIENYAKIKNEQLNDHRRTKRFFNVENVQVKMDNPFNQRIIDELRKEISENRVLLHKQNDIHNQTFDMQIDINNRTSKELENIFLDLKFISNKTLTNDINIRLNQLIQSVILGILRNSEIFDALHNMVKNPYPSDVLKVVNHNELYNIFSNLNSTISSHELIANSSELNVFNILELSKIRSNLNKNGLKLSIDTPITTNSWTVFKTYPVIFENGGKLFELTNISEYLLIHNQNDHLLLSKSEFENCFSPIERVYLCTLNEIDSHKNSCEADIMWRHELGLCKSKPAANQVRIVEINEKMIYVNNFNHLNIV